MHIHAHAFKPTQFEKEREETRAIENNFKIKMKALYDKRVKELESVQKELESVSPSCVYTG